jgi:hypothetical protein
VPKPLFQTRLEFDLLPRQYDVSADGKRFLLAQPLEEGATVPDSYSGRYSGVTGNFPSAVREG